MVGKCKILNEYKKVPKFCVLSPARKTKDLGDLDVQKFSLA